MKKTNLLVLAGLFGMVLTACGAGTGGETYVKSVSISVEAEAKDGFDAVVEPNKTLKLNYTYTPENASQNSVKWVVSDSNVGSVSKSATEKVGTFNAKDEGQVTVHLEMPGANNTTVKSNELKMISDGILIKNHNVFC